MEIQGIISFITQKLSNTHCQEHDGSFFFFYGAERKLPFATIVTKDDDYDNVSNLNRPGVFRLNIGVGRETFTALFGGIKSKPGFGGFMESGIDFTELNKILPHPVYGNLYWVSVLNPSDETFDHITPYLLEAYNKAALKKAN